MPKVLKEKILVVEDDRPNRLSLAAALGVWGYEPVEAETVAGALAAHEAESPAAVLLDLELPDGSGFDVLKEVMRRQPEAVVIIITGSVEFGNAVEALRGGAYDFINKPVDLNELQVTIRNGIEARRMRRELGLVRREREREFGLDRIVGESPAVRGVLGLARKVAESEVSSVLLQGESGTGKDLIAKAIHYASRRADAPFVAINCAAIPAALIESELFGYEKGAFTDAKARKEGLFEQAEGGTLFLDEIGELELGLQAKLLRVLEEGSFRRVGGLKDVDLDVRVVAASNRDLKAEAGAGRFRLDLYYRLSVIQVDVPPLRERGGDVLLLADHFLAELGGRLRKSARRLSPEVEDAFCRYSWPGNVRELRNVIERALILEEGDMVTAEHLPPGLARALGSEPAGPVEAVAPPIPPRAAGPAPDDDGYVDSLVRLPQGGIPLDRVEMSLIRQALAQSGGNQTKAAALVGITRDQLVYRLRKRREAGVASSAAEGGEVGEVPAS